MFPSPKKDIGIHDKEILVRLSESWSDFWNIDNGITLCEKCHNTAHNKKTHLKG